MTTVGPQTPARRVVLSTVSVAACAAVLWFVAVNLYAPALVAGIAVGFVAALWFLIIHRPSRWWRAVAINAAGLNVALALLYGRQIILLALTWPPDVPETLAQAMFSIGMLALVDALLIVKVVVFRRYVAADALTRSDAGHPPAERRTLSPGD